MAHQAGLFVVEPLTIKIRLPTDPRESAELAACVRVSAEAVQGVRFVQDGAQLQIVVPKLCDAHMLQQATIYAVDAYYAERSAGINVG